MVPFEILILSALAASSTAHSSPVPAPQAGGAQIQSSHFLDWSQTRFSDGEEVPISHTGYQCYTSKYPHPHRWLSWNYLWNINREQVLSSNGGNTYVQHYVEEGILQAADESCVDARLLLAVVMQESKGKADGECKDRSRCGIIRGGKSFDEKRPNESILEMLREGVRGSQSRLGLAKRLKIAESPYPAVWQYHEGDDFPASGQGEAQYLSDVANRLMGWDGRKKGYRGCSLQE